MSSLTPLMRSRASHADGRVSFVELFFDLVFVFAITQISHRLLEHFSVLGAVQVLLLSLTIWMQWVFTTWVTNWLNPERPAVRLMLLALMLAGLTLSSSIPGAFEQRAGIFAAMVVLMHVGRTLFTLWAVWGTHQQANFSRILAWAIPFSLLWILGAQAQGTARLVLWALGILTCYVPAFFGFYVPGLGRTQTAEWDIDGEHMAERAGLFVIIALGESLLVSGATLAHSTWSGVHWLGFITAFLGTVAMWWLYFVTNAEVGSRAISESEDPGRLARNVYTVIHFYIVLGIIFTAVGDEFILVHPTDSAHALRIIFGVVGGPLLFLVGNLAFKSVVRSLPYSHLVGVALLVVLGVVAYYEHLNTLTLAMAVAAVQMGVAAWESKAAPVQKDHLPSH